MGSSLSLLLAWCLLVLQTFGQEEQCKATGIDFTDGGTYAIDSSSTRDFTFATEFSGM